MGGQVARPRRIPHNRRRELMFLFYFVIAFITIRIWIIIIDTNNVYIEIGGALITFLICLLLYLRHRRLRQQEARNIHELHDEINNGHFHLFIIQNGLGALLEIRNQPARPSGLSQEVIDTLPTFVYEKDKNKENAIDNNDIETGKDQLASGSVLEESKNDNNESNENEVTCSVCLANYVDGERIMKLPCSHIYHKDCISEWILRHNDCPLCKQNISAMLEANQENNENTETSNSGIPAPTNIQNDDSNNHESVHNNAESTA